MKTLLVTGLAGVTLLFTLATASAQDRVGDAVMGGVAGALVGGPVGAVAGGAIGYTAGPGIARSMGIHRHYHHHRHSRAWYRRHSVERRY
jgi:membrane protein DedA with SNARE-associated domain